MLDKAVQRAFAGHTNCLPATPLHTAQERSLPPRFWCERAPPRRCPDAAAPGCRHRSPLPRRDAPARPAPACTPHVEVAPAPRSAGSARRVPAPRIRRCAGAAYRPWLRVLLLGTWRCPQPIAHLGRHVQPCAAHQLLAIVDRCLRSPHYVFSARSWEQVHLFNTRPPVCQRAVAPHSRRQRDSTV